MRRAAFVAFAFVTLSAAILSAEPIKSKTENLTIGHDGSPLRAARPSAIAACGSFLAVADRPTGRVVRCDLEGKPVAVLVENGPAEGRVTRPSDLYYDAERDLLVVADEGGRRVVAFELQGGDASFAWESKGDPGSPFRKPVKVEGDGLGNFYVVDEEADAVTVLGSGGRFLSRVQGGKGGFRKPGDVAVVANGVVLVLDIPQRKIFAYDGPDMRLRTESASVSDISNAGALAVNSHCELFVLGEDAMLTAPVASGLPSKLVKVSLNVDFGRESAKGLSCDGRDVLFATGGGRVVRVALQNLDPSLSPCAAAPVVRLQVTGVEPDTLVPGNTHVLRVTGSGFTEDLVLESGNPDVSAVGPVQVLGDGELTVEVAVVTEAVPGAVTLRLVSSRGEASWTSEIAAPPPEIAPADTVAALAPPAVAETRALRPSLLVPELRIAGEEVVIAVVTSTGTDGVVVEVEGRELPQVRSGIMNDLDLEPRLLVALPPGFVDPEVAASLTAFARSVVEEGEIGIQILGSPVLASFTRKVSDVEKSLGEASMGGEAAPDAVERVLEGLSIDSGTRTLVVFVQEGAASVTPSMKSGVVPVGVVVVTEKPSLVKEDLPVLAEVATKAALEPALRNLWTTWKEAPFVAVALSEVEPGARTVRVRFQDSKGEHARDRLLVVPPRDAAKGPGWIVYALVPVGLLTAGGAVWAIRRRGQAPRARLHVTASRVADLPVGSEIGLKAKRVILGRSEASLPRFGHPWISRNHAVLEFRGGAWRITDLSRNGTYLDGASLAWNKAGDLRDGAVVSLARVIELRFERG